MNAPSESRVHVFDILQAERFVKVTVPKFRQRAPTMSSLYHLERASRLRLVVFLAYFFCASWKAALVTSSCSSILNSGGWSICVCFGKFIRILGATCFVCKYFFEVHPYEELRSSKSVTEEQRGQS